MKSKWEEFYLLSPILARELTDEETEEYQLTGCIDIKEGVFFPEADNPIILKNQNGKIEIVEQEFFDQTFAL